MHLRRLSTSQTSSLWPQQYLRTPLTSSTTWNSTSHQPLPRCPRPGSLVDSRLLYTATPPAKFSFASDIAWSCFNACCNRLEGAFPRSDNPMWCDNESAMTRDDLVRRDSRSVMTHDTPALTRQRACRNPQFPRATRQRVSWTPQ